MKKLTINGHTVKLHDSIETMPIDVFHRFNLFVSIDAGIGGTIEDVDRRLFRAREFMRHNQKDNAVAELDNMRQALAFVIENNNPEFLSFAALIHSIDDKRIQVSDESECREALAMLAKKGITVGTIRRALEDVKKKIDAEMALYFPQQQESAREKEHFLRLKERAMLILDKVLGHEVEQASIDKVDAFLLQATKPQRFWGSDGKEARTIVNFQDICISLSQHVPKDPHKMSVLEFFRTLEIVKKRIKQAERGRQKMQ